MVLHWETLVAQAASASGVDFLAPHKKSLKTECAPYVCAL